MTNIPCTLLHQLKERLEVCEANLEKGGLAPVLAGAKQALAHHDEQIKDVESASLRTFCRGEELVDYLKQSEVELRVKDPLTSENIDAQIHIHNLLEFLHRKRRDIRDLAEDRRIKLEQNLLLRRLESDTKQVGWVLLLTRSPPRVTIMYGYILITCLHTIAVNNLGEFCISS